MRSLISNNCWAGYFYGEAGVPYDTPTVGLWIGADHYLRFLQSFRLYISAELEFPSTLQRSYPVGLLGGDVEIEFMHYLDRDEAKKKWIRRCQRLPRNDADLFVKICDRDGFTAEHLDKFVALPFLNKAAFIKKGRYPHKASDNIVEIECTGETVMDGIALAHLMKVEMPRQLDRWLAR